MMNDDNGELPSNDVHEVIVDVHQEFFRFLTRRLGSVDEAGYLESAVPKTRLVSTSDAGDSLVRLAVLYPWL